MTRAITGKAILFMVLSLFFVDTKTGAQSCKIAVDSLVGEYSGDCHKGYAEGKGTAKGADTYTGDFKKGYPDGTGKYLWKNGNWYEGGWKKGLFHGTGSLSKKEATTDSTIFITGTWENGKYIGRYQKPYNINALTGDISGLNIRKQKRGTPDIEITVKSITGGGLSINSPGPLPKCRLTSIDLLEGRFDRQDSDETSSPVTNKYILRRVSYPFSAILTFESIGASNSRSEKISVEILESGYWYIQVDIDN